MKIERGIVVVGTDNKIMVKSVGAIYYLPQLIEPIEFNLNDKVLGVVTDNKFHIIFNFKLSVGTNYLGYYSKKWIEDNFKVQTIRGLNPSTFDPYNSEYELGEELELNRNQVLSITTL